MNRLFKAILPVMALLAILLASGCIAPPPTVTTTVTTTVTAPATTVTVTAPGKTVTTTVTAAATTVTSTVTAPGVTTTVTAPATTVTVTTTVTAPAPTPTPTPTPVPTEFPGVTVTVISIPWLNCAVKKTKDAWEKKTGAKVKIIDTPYAALHEKVVTDFVTKAGMYDIIIHPSLWIGEFVMNDWLQDIGELGGVPAWDDVLPALQRDVTWGGKIVTFPFDGDWHMLYYRKDALENPRYKEEFKKKYGYYYHVPPLTWEEVRDIAEFFNGWDWDGDGETEYGIVFIAKRGTQAVWTLLDLVAQYNVVHARPSKGNYGSMFFDPETMDCLLDEPGAIYALEMLCELAKYGPPGLLGYGYSEMREAFVSGVAAMAIDWGDIGIMEWWSEGSKVAGKLGYGPLPGASKYWDAVEKKWVERYNHNNYADFGGWVMSISKFSKNKEAAYSLACYLCSPETSLMHVTGAVGCWGNNPYRFSHFDVDKWLEVGKQATHGPVTRESAQGYLNAILAILSDPMIITEFRLPGAEEMWDKLDAELCAALAGMKSPEDAIKAAAKAWEDIVAKYGKDKMLKLYRQMLGLPT